MNPAKKPYNLGLTLCKKGDWAKSIPFFEEAIQLEENKSHSFYKLDWRHRLAFAYRVTGQYEKAEKIYIEAGKLDPHVLSWLKFSKPNWEKVKPESLIPFWGLLDGELKNQSEALKLIDQAEKFSTSFPEKWWFNAYSEIYKKGWAQAAYRCKSIASDIQRKCFPFMDYQSKDLFQDYAAAFLEVNDFASALDCVNKQIEAGSQVLEACDFKYSTMLLEGKQRDANLFWQKVIQEQAQSHDPDYAKLIKGKRIAVVAPGNTGVDNGAEIDSFDVVARTNFRSHQTIRSQSALLGTRTDICYFNGNFEPANREEIVTTFKSEPIQYAVLRFHDQEALDIYKPLLSTRVSHIFNAFYKMNTYAIPKIIVDLARYEPAEIKIFNADFYLRDNKHHKGYYDYDIDLILSFMGHDVLRNFRLVKDFYQAGVIQVDDVLRKVLDFNENEVIHRAEEILSQILAKKSLSV